MYNQNIQELFEFKTTAETNILSFHLKVRDFDESLGLFRIKQNENEKLIDQFHNA
jgi:hypothetical protein